LSESGLSYMRSLLNDPGWVQAYPSHAVALRQQFDAATKITNQDKPEVTDERTPQQARHDHVMGIEDRPATAYELEAPTGFAPPEGKTTTDVLGEARELCAALQLEPILARAVVRDMLGAKPDAGEVMQLFLRTNQNYADAIKAVNAAFAHATKRGFKGELPRAEELPAYALAMLAGHGRQLERWAKGRPA